MTAQRASLIVVERDFLARRLLPIEATWPSGGPPILGTGLGDRWRDLQGRSGRLKDHGRKDLEAA